MEVRIGDKVFQYARLSEMLAAIEDVEGVSSATVVDGNHEIVITLNPDGVDVSGPCDRDVVYNIVLCLLSIQARELNAELPPSGGGEECSIQSLLQALE